VLVVCLKRTANGRPCMAFGFFLKLCKLYGEEFGRRGRSIAVEELLARLLVERLAVVRQCVEQEVFLPVKRLDREPREDEGTRFALEVFNHSDTDWMS